MSQTSQEQVIGVIYTSLKEISSSFGDAKLNTQADESDLTDLSSDGEEKETGETSGQASTPRKKGKKNRSLPKKLQRLEQRILRLVTKMVTIASQNKVVFGNISMKDILANGLPDDASDEPTVWLHDWTWDPESGTPPTPRLGVDRDGVPIVLWLPQFLSDDAHNKLLETTINFGKAVEKALSMGSGSDSCGRNRRDAYRIVPGELSGCINIAIWHAVGHENEDPILSRDQLGTSSRLSHCEEIISNLSLATARLNKILELLDPPAFSSHHNLRTEMSKFPFARARMHIDPSLWQGRSIIFNRQTPDHIDRRDDPKEWVPLFTLGRFRGGAMRLRTLGLRMWFGGGSCVFIRGGMFPHGIEPFDGSQRISFAHFAHKSLWRRMGVELESLGFENLGA